MKIKWILICSCLLFLAVSCSKKGYDMVSYPVIFSVPEYSAEVKTEISDVGFVKDDAIGVMAYYVPSGVLWESYKAGAKPDFMYNQKVTYDGSMWSYSPVMYWPQADGACVNFYSYFPYGDGTGETGVKMSAADTKGEPSFDFVLSGDADVDLMVAQNEGCDSGTGSVGLEFRHVLGKLQFKFGVSDEGGFSYVVNKIKVLSTPKEATYTWADDSFNVFKSSSVVASAGVGAEGCLINTTTPMLVEDFTMFLMPSDLGKIQITINNEDPMELDLSHLKVESGKILTIAFVINLTGIQFTTSVTDWVDGGTASGNIS